MDKHRLLEDILSDLNGDAHFFEELLEGSGVTPRNIMQMYMLYKFKWNWSRDTGKDIGYEGTLHRWVEEGYATHFAEVYNEQKTIWGMYQTMLHYQRGKQPDVNRTITETE